MKYVISILLSLLFLNPCVAQTTDVDFLVQKIKQNYPGYHDKTNDVVFDKFVAKTMSENKSDTFKMMSKIVDFFKDRHLDLFQKMDSINRQTCKQNLEETLAYFQSHKHLKKHEGFWISNQIIAIRQTSSHPLEYKAYVIESRDSNKLPPGFAVYKFEQIKSNEFYTKATSVGIRKNFYIHAIFRNDSVMTAGPYNKWHKINLYQSPLLSKLPKAKLDSATGRWIDADNFLISIPASYAYNSAVVDSIIKANPAITTKLNNLIIDIRGNTGGRTATYVSTMPLIYTNPILEVNAEIYCSKERVEDLKSDLANAIKKNSLDSSQIKEEEDWIKHEENSIGKYIAGPQDTIVFDSILPFPKHVSIIVDFGCQSAAEIFLLNAKQSKKVTLFGEHTMGAIDYLDYFPIELPSKKYNLNIASTRRIIPPNGRKLDGIGIQPDVPISDSEKDWVDFVKRYYEKH